MKKVMILLVALAFISCEKEDNCDCYYSEVHHQWVPDKQWEQALTEYPTTGERKAALNASCRNQGCGL